MHGNWGITALGLLSRPSGHHGWPRLSVLSLSKLKNLASIAILATAYLSFIGCGASSGMSGPDAPRPLIRATPKARLRQPVVLQGSVLQPTPEVGQTQLPLRDTPEVRRFFHAFRDGRYRTFLEDAFTRYDLYVPMMTSVLQSNNLPTELVSVALVESRLQPAVKSPMGAVGLWQFMKVTAREYGLRVDFFRDERKDPVRSTEAAAQYLSDLYQQFGDWWLAIAAYNAGPSRISSLLQEGDDFFSLESRGVLPRETVNFVNKIIAATLVLRHSDAYGLRPKAQ